MGESELHRDEMWRLIYALQSFFAAVEDIHVSGNLIMYYEEGNSRASICPDVMVVRGVPRLPRRDTYLLWEEGESPCFVIEVTSASTRTVDERKKRDLYAQLGVQEYILYDPCFPGLEPRYPPLRGYTLGPAGYEPLALAADGSLLSEELGLLLVLEKGVLQLFDPRTGTRLLDPAERAELGAERAREAAARRAAEARIAELEALLREQRPPSAE